MHEGSIMPTILDLLYREYCRARLAEMRKQLFVRLESHERSEATIYTGLDHCAAEQENGPLGDWPPNASHHKSS
jgi:hypothetical protein